MRKKRKLIKRSIRTATPQLSEGRQLAVGRWRKQFMWRDGDDVRLQPVKTRFGTRGGSVTTTSDQRHNQEQDKTEALC